jgi:GxxExxY protein
MVLSRWRPDEPFTGLVLDCAMRVHTALGPGLLESAYEVCLAHELSRRGAKVSRQASLPVVYDGIQLEAGYRIDLMVEDALIVEVKAVDKLMPIHTAQLLSYLKLAKVRFGLLLNFNVVHLKDGIKRVVNG